MIGSLVTVYFAVIALIRGGRMSGLLVLTAVFLTGMTIASLNYYPRSENRRLQELKKFVAHQLSHAAAEASRTGEGKFLKIEGG